MKAVSIMFTTLALVAHTSTVGAELKPVARTVVQTGSPVSITKYTAEYRRRSQYVDEGIHHSIEYQNTSQKPVEAVQFGLVSFDIWNQYLDRTNGVSTDEVLPGKSDKGTWIARAYADFSFLTGIAYVKRVRFADGEIWTADEDQVVTELRKIEKDFDVSILKKKDDGPDK